MKSVCCYFYRYCFRICIGHYSHNSSVSIQAAARSPALVRAGLGAGCVIGPFRYPFETLPQPLPELREGGSFINEVGMLLFLSVLLQDLHRAL